MPAPSTGRPPPSLSDDDYTGPDEDADADEIYTPRLEQCDASYNSIDTIDATGGSILWYCNNCYIIAVLKKMHDALVDYDALINGSKDKKV